jgi:hypothetical protein
VGDYTSLAFTNTIIAGHHSVGITVTTGSTATLEATLWGSSAWANGEDWGGGGTIVTGTINVWGDPAFVNPDGGDYHIGPGSAAIDVGVDAGVETDIDGEPRPTGTGHDIGADEFVCVALAGVTIGGPLTGTVDSTYIFTATATPADATPPITYTWSPSPDGGQGSANVSYTWTTTGTKTINVTASNCGGTGTADDHAITIESARHDIYLPLVLRNYQ